MMEEKKQRSMKVEDFNIISVIGQGSYAKVLLVENKNNKKLYAMKVLKKEKVERRKQQKHVWEELNILKDADHPFIIKFSSSFQNAKKLYFLLEYCPGGELFNLLSKQKKFSEIQAIFYASQMILALEHLHSKDIIYRDLKPENVLIDIEGYIRITDFGLSRKDISDPNGAKSICGTPEYLAPEIVMKMNYGKAVDWWTLGSIIYEMLVGIPPFYTNNRAELFERIKFANPKYKDYMSENVKDILKKLLKKDPSKRLGSKGAEEIKSHPWFSEVNWDAMLNKEYNALFIPSINKDTDLKYFDTEFTEAPTKTLSMSNSARVGKEIIGFSHNNDPELKPESFRDIIENNIEMVIEE